MILGVHFRVPGRIFITLFSVLSGFAVFSGLGPMEAQAAKYGDPVTSDFSDVPTVCADPFSTPEVQKFLKERRLVVEDGRPKFDEMTKGFFIEQRRRLQSLVAAMNRDNFEQDYYIHRSIMALMNASHVLATGEPGANKSRIAKDLLRMLIPQIRNGKVELGVDNFSIQMNEMQSDTIIRGFWDPEKAKNLEFNSLFKRMEEAKTDNELAQILHDAGFRIKGTMFEYRTAHIDEIEKGNLIAIAAMLDIINERIANHGALVLKARTRTVIATSNLTPYEYLNQATSMGYESTARAILDRFQYKVLAANKLLAEGNVGRLIKQGSRERDRKAKNFFENIDEDYRPGGVADSYVSPFDYVDFFWLGNLAQLEGVFDLPESTYGFLEQLTDAIGKEFNQMSSDSQKSIEEGTSEAGRPKYYPTTLMSSRNVRNISTASIRSSLLFDLLTDDKIPDATLIQILETGRIPVDIDSAWRVSEWIVTAAPGDARYVEESNDKDKSLQVRLRYDKKALATLEERAPDSRTKATYYYAQREREIFERIYNDMLDSWKDSWNKNAEALALMKLLGGNSQKPISTIEELLMVRGSWRHQPFSQAP